MNSKGNMTLKHWANEDKPREKMLEKGRRMLSNAELLGILIGSGSTEKNAIELGQEILFQCNNNLLNLSKMEPKDLMKKKGIGPAKAVTISAAMELGRRLLNEEADKGDVVHCSTDIYHYIASKIIDISHEEFWALFLNIRHKVIGCEKISSGGITETSVDIRMIFKFAVEQGAVAIAVAHNHPSGNTKPSRADDKLTERIREAGKLLDIHLVDHIIIGDNYEENKYYSYCDNDRL